MAIYYCEGCDKYVDDDWHPMEESELCPDCHNERQYEREQRETHLSLKLYGETRQ